MLRCSKVVLRISFGAVVLLVSEICLISGLPDPAMDSYSGLLQRRLPGDGQVYNLYLEPAKEGTLKDFDLITDDKRSRLFVGKRQNEDYYNPEDYGDLILHSVNPFTVSEIKRNHLFVGKRGSPRFVGKRSVNSRFAKRARVKRFALEESKGRYYEIKDGQTEKELDNESDQWKDWLVESQDRTDTEKRSRMFVGKRPEEETEKRSRMFVGKRPDEEDSESKRSRLFVGRRAEDRLESEMDTPTETDGKRSRLFVGKRPGLEYIKDITKSSENSGFSAKQDHFEEVDDQHGIDKRVHMFPGKRPAPGFVGKRQDP